MRQIKFRAWNKRTKKMCDCPNGYNARSSDDFVWMQFTGLLDKNGKEIYEGDIEKNPITGQINKVIFEEGGFRTLYPLSEVIGNIYENPELLK